MEVVDHRQNDYLSSDSSENSSHYESDSVGSELIELTTTTLFNVAGRKTKTKLKQFQNDPLHTTNQDKKLIKREKNRLAAQRCRQKQMQRISMLEQEVMEIEFCNYQVELEIRSLHQQVKELSHMLRYHRCIRAAPPLSHGALLPPISHGDFQSYWTAL